MYIIILFSQKQFKAKVFFKILTDACRVACAMHVNEYNADAWETPGNVKDREMFKRDEVAISLITSEEELFFSAKLHSIQVHLKRLKLTMGMY